MIDLTKIPETPKATVMQMTAIHEDNVQGWVSPSIQTNVVGVDAWERVRKQYKTFRLKGGGYLVIAPQEQQIRANFWKKMFIGTDNEAEMRKLKTLHRRAGKNYRSKHPKAWAAVQDYLTELYNMAGSVK